MSKRTNYDLTAIARNIRPLVKKILGPSGLMQVEMLSNWSEIVGEDLAAYSFPEKIDFKHNQKNNGTLHLIVPSGAFALELQHKEPQILSKINTFFGYGAVSSIKIIQNNEMQFEKKKKQLQKTQKPIVVSDEDKKYIDESGAKIKDAKLKEILIKLGYSVFNEND